MNDYQSWGRYPKVQNQSVLPIYWRSELPELSQLGSSVLAYGKGRSYGDVCLNEGGTLIDVSRLNHFVEFDSANGLLTAEAGVTFAEILETFVPAGWFLPVTPGTQNVTVGGAAANDVHGKNHHRAGTFGCHVEALELLRSSGERVVCSREKNPELFAATIGGLGLTGLILWVSFRLKKIPSPMIQMESIRFENLEEFFGISEDSDLGGEYTVAWVDCLTEGASLGRGHLMRGDFAAAPDFGAKRALSRAKLSVPFDFPGFVLNPWTVKAFNHFYFNRQKEKKVTRTVFYEPFFYPLDAIQDWNRIYGPAGFFQYQCVVPKEGGAKVLKTLFTQIAASGQASFLTVLKAFGDIKSPGMLSFPRPGFTLALDFPNRGARTLDLMNRLDQEVLDAGGAVNPSKDARMSPAVFKKSFPRWEEFSKQIDPKFSSSFWRRVMKD